MIEHKTYLKIFIIFTKAGVNFDPNTPENLILDLLGSRGVGATSEMNSSYKTYDPEYDIMIPLKFDARKQWLRCQTIGAVRDQGHCGSSWVSYRLNSIVFKNVNVSIC